MRDCHFVTVLCTVLAVGASAMIPAPANARESSQPAEEREIARCIRVAAGGKPWLERTLWGLRDQEGGWLGAAVLNSNGSHDLGPLQINSWWVPRIAAVVGRPVPHVRDWLRTDACFNAGAARWIFLTALAESRDYWKAIGIYHSPTEWRQRRYAANVAGKLQRRFGALVFRAEPVSYGRVGSDVTSQVWNGGSIMRPTRPIEPQTLPHTRP